MVTVLCFIIALVMFVHILRTWNSENKRNYKRINEIIYTLLLLAFGAYYPFLIVKIAGKNKGIVFDTAFEEFTFLGNLLIVGIMIGIFCWGLSAKIRTIRNPELLKGLNNYEVFCKEFLEEYPNRSKIKRRITHVLPFAVVSLCVLVFYLFFRTLLGKTWSNYAIMFIIIIGVDFALTFIIQDLIRLFDFSYMPPNAIKMCKAGLTPEELNTFSSTAVMVFSFGPFLFVSFPVFFVVLLITSVADAMASIGGILMGDKKHNFPKSTDKSIEGYISGFGFTFVCTVFGTLFSNFFGLSNWSLDIILLLSLTLSIAFVLIDIITSKLKLQDNYINPFVCGIVAILTLIMLNISIFYRY